MSNALARTSGGGWLVAPQNMSEVYAFAKTIAESTFCPKDMRGRAGDVIAAIQLGSELGMSPMAALQGICVINGRPSLYGDALLALVLAQPDVLDVVEDYDDKTRTASCTVIRQRGTRERSTTRTFSWDDAVKAKLSNKTGPWTDYPKRMQAMRARSWALRDACPDILRGMIAHEEAQDIPQQVQATVVQEVMRSKPGDSPRTLVSDLQARAERMQPSEPEQPPANQQQRPLPTRTTAKYHVKALADRPFTELAHAELTDYVAHYADKLTNGQLQDNHRVAINATIAAAQRELESRIEEEANSAAADPGDESEPEAPADVPDEHEPQPPADLVEWVDDDGVIHHAPADSIEGQLALSVEKARQGIDPSNSNAALGLDDPRVKPTTEKRARRSAS